MRRSRLAASVALAGILAATAVSCSEDQTSGLPTPKAAFCEAAWNYDHRIERGTSIPEQITILEKVERNAPKDVATDASLFLDTMREGEHATEKQRAKLQEDPKFKQAVNNVNRRAINGCDFFKKEPGEGGI